MLSIFKTQSLQYRLTSILLVVGLLFTTWHVTQHEIAFAGDNEAHEECQVCRLTHTPATDVDSSVSLLPLFILIALSISTAIRFISPYKHQTQRARAPPLY